MNYRTIGKSDLKVSEVGFGAWQAGHIGWGDDFSDRDIKEALSFAFDSGINYLDTAEMYGNGHSEEVIGEVLPSYEREKIVVATKVNPPHFTQDQVIRSAGRSIERMKCDYIDLYQLHWPDSGVPVHETAGALKTLVKDGLVRNVGVCNFNVPELKGLIEALGDIPVVSNQMRYNILQRGVENELYPFMKKQGIEMIAWSPIAKGLLSGKYSRDNLPDDDIRKRDSLFSPEVLGKLDPLFIALRRIAKTHEKTMTQIALNYLISKGAIVIPGIKRKDQMRENMGASGFRLSEPEIAEIDRLSKID